MAVSKLASPAVAQLAAASPNVAALRESATIAVSARAKALRAAGRPIIDLGAGEPDFPTPSFISEAGARAVDGGATRYSPTEGILPLRQAIAAAASRRFQGSPIEATDVIVSNGSKQSLFNACFALFGPGDEVLIPVPSWTSYFEMVSLARATAVEVRGARSRDLRVSADMLDSASTARTRGVILNSPVNPTGAVYTADELREIHELARSRGWWVITDEIYARIAYGAPVASMLDVVSTRENLIVVDGVAKAYSMTGWRIGWAIAPAAATRSMAALQSHTTYGASTPAQHAALAALTGGDEAQRTIDTMVAEFHVRRDLALRELGRANGLDVIVPDGAFYLYMNVAPLGLDSEDPGSAFCRELLERYDLALVPGAAFRTPDWVRMSFAAERSSVVEGARRIVAAWNALREAATP